MKFTHLHVHSDYSPDSINTVELICKTAHLQESSAIAVTDHGSLSNIHQFAQYANLYKIKPIFGNEMYLDWLQDPESSKLFHITILAKNKIGYQNLIKLNNLAHEQIVVKSNGNFPVCNIQNLADYREGLIVLTGCPASVLHELEDEAEALEYVSTLKNVFADNLFIELMLQYKAKENLERCKLAQSKFNLQLVLSNDAHFTYKWQNEIHGLSVMAKKGYTYSSDGLYIAPIEDVIENAAKYLNYDEVLQIIENTNRVADSVEKFSVKEKPKLPKMPKNYREELVEFFNSVVEEKYRSQMEFELKVFEDMDFLPYLYIIYVMRNFCKDNGIFIRCRGSGAGSYLVYLLGIAPVHPIEFGLYFDRFVNYSRVDDFPDLDLDVDPQRRHEIFEFMLTRFGMLPVSTFLVYSHKSAIHDICRVLKKVRGIEIPYKIEEAACEGDELSDSFTELCQIDPIIKPFYDSIIDTCKTRGKHAAAVASPSNLVPIENWHNERTLALSESGSGAKNVQDSGNVKLDILSVDALAINAICEKLSGVKFSLDLADDKVFELFASGSLAGIFQFKSGASVKLSRMIRPSSLHDISAIVALNRPGPLDSGMAWLYAGYKENPRKLHEKLDDVLIPSYGVIIYQEQVMELFSRITGEGAAGRNDARKYLVPKSFKLLTDPKFIAVKEELFQKFMNLGQANEYSEEILKKIWHEMDTFGRYGFNAAHSYTYAFNSLESAFYKVKYPEIFFLACMQVEDTNADGRRKIQEFCFEAANIGVNLKTPHILYSSVNFELIDNTIYFPLTALKGMGEERVKQLIEYRKTNEITKFSDVNKIPKTIVNKGAKKNLLLLGGFAGLEEDVKIDIDYATLEEFKNKSQGDIQMATMGFLLPSKKLMDMLKLLKNSDEVLGYVFEIKAGMTKTNKPKRIISLYPKGYFSIMDFDLDINVGDLVFARLNEYNMPDRLNFLEKKLKYKNKFGKFVLENGEK